MGKRKNSTTTIIVMLFLLIFSLPALAALTTTQMRENTIRINALELKNLEIKDTEAPKEMTVVLDERALNFDFDKSEVKPEYHTVLLNIIKYVEFYNYNMQIVGHTDSKGSEDYNLKLGQRRADSVRDKLIELGLDSTRILGTSSMGETEPVATNDTEEGTIQNRRIEFKLELRENK